ncbi:hypothetical protein DFH11DRAFT_1609986 [Phellopilus nigrolimitatus]|nr:hypothetical protein DFH11DRAFT_1609986 [Phellopilus nigrolimitatus]
MQIEADPMSRRDTQLGKKNEINVNAERVVTWRNGANGRARRDECRARLRLGARDLRIPGSFFILSFFKLKNEWNREALLLANRVYSHAQIAAPQFADTANPQRIEIEKAFWIHLKRHDHVRICTDMYGSALILRDPCYVFLREKNSRSEPKRSLKREDGRRACAPVKKTELRTPGFQRLKTEAIWRQPKRVRSRITHGAVTQQDVVVARFGGGAAKKEPTRSMASQPRSNRSGPPLKNADKNETIMRVKEMYRRKKGAVQSANMPGPA